MNCANHPEASVEAYCQQCGKPLCSQCVRTVAGIVSCEPCLAARLGVAGAANPASFYSGSSPASAAYSGDARPGLAAFLGIIPGVGAMYNGQFVKALVHVLVFVILISLTDQHGPFGIFIAAWVFYQIFDAYQTAKARRDGMPLPDPFGLNDLGARLGLHPMPAVPVAPVAAPNTAYPQAPAQQTAYDPAAFQAAAYPPPPDSTVPYPPIPPLPPRRPEPIGAIVLIVLGTLFLLSSLHIFSLWWVGRGWPIILIVLGVWLIVRRTRELPEGGSK